MPEDNYLATGEQPLSRGDGVHPRKDVCTMVKQDLDSRIDVGEKRYGERLTTFNGRDSLQDAYQEVLDLVMYLRQEIEERQEYRKWEDWARSWFGDAMDMYEKEVPTFEEIKWRAEEERKVRVEAQTEVLKYQRERIGKTNHGA